jgi:hypothetical protein
MFYHKDYKPKTVPERKVLILLKIKVFERVLECFDIFKMKVLFHFERDN